MAGRNTWANEATGNTTQDSSAWEQKCSITFTPSANKRYWLLGSGDIGSNSLTVDAQARIRDNTGSADLAAFNIESKDLTDYRALTMVGSYTASASPVSTNFTLDFKAESAGTLAAMQNARIVAIEENAADLLAESTGSSTTTSSTYSDKTSLAVTPTGTEDWIIIAYAELAISGTGGAIAAGVKLNDGTNDFFSSNISIGDTTTYYPWFAVKKVTLSSSTTYTIKYNSKDNVKTTTIRNARIIAMKASTFASVQYAESTSRSTTSSTTYQDKTTLTFTPAAETYIIMSAGVGDSNSISNSRYGNLLEDSTTIFEEIQEWYSTTTNKMPYGGVYQKTLTASSKTWKTQHRCESGGSDVSGIADSVIIALQVTPVSSTVNGAASLSASGSMSSTGRSIKHGVSSLSATGSLSSSAKTIVSGASSLSSTATILGTANLIIKGIASLSGSGALSSTARIINNGQASLSVSGSLAGTANIFKYGSALLSASVLLEASTNVYRKGASALSITGTLESTALVVKKGSSSLSGSLSLDATSQVIKRGVSTLSCAAAFDVTPVLILSTGFISAAAGYSDNSYGGTAWADVGNITASDNANASAVLSASPGYTEGLLAYDFGFAIPAAATIRGIIVEVEKGFTGSGGVSDSYAYLFFGSYIDGVNHALAGGWAASDTTYQYGGINDKWGPFGSSTINPATVNDTNFGVSLAANYDSGSPTATVDRVRMNIFYVAAVGSSVAMQASVTISATANVIKHADSAISSAGTISASAKSLAIASSALSCAGSLAATANIIKHGSSSLAGVFAISASVNMGFTVNGSAALSGTGSLSVTPNVISHNVSSLFCESVFGSTSNVIKHGVSGVSISGNLSSVSNIISHNASALLVASTIASNASVMLHSISSLSCVSSISATANVIKLGASSLSGQFLISGNGYIAGSTVKGTALLFHNANITAVSNVVLHATALLQGAYSVTAVSNLFKTGEASLLASLSIGVSSTVFVKTSVALSVAGLLSSTSKIFLSGQASLAASVSLSAVPHLTIHANSILSVVSTCSAVPGFVFEGSVIRGTAKYFITTGEKCAKIFHKDVHFIRSEKVKYKQ